MKRLAPPIVAPGAMALALNLLLATNATAQGGPHFESVSFPASNANAVTLRITAPSQAVSLRAVVKLNGANVTSLFVPVAGTNSMTATVPGLVNGANTVQLLLGKKAAALLDQAQIHVITQADCNAAKLGTAIDPSLIGEPVSAVTLSAPTWTNASATNQAYCRVNGAMAPIDPAAPDINFGVTLPARWAHRYMQQGGGGSNGSIPGLANATYNNLGMASAGSDSGHQGSAVAWTVNDESMWNFSYLQMKKTHDAAQVLQQRAYGALPTYKYWFGNSQGGREGLAMVQRYPDHFHGVAATVPIVGLNSLQWAPAWVRIQEKPLANWVTQAKRNAITTEVIRQCDGLDGLVDGLINNYQACRAVFDVKQGAPNRQPWASKRCPGGVDPAPELTTADACLTDGQIETLQFTHTRYLFATPLADGRTSFGMFLPGTDPGGNDLIMPNRYRGQEGAAANAPIYNQPGIAGVYFVMQDLGANPLDYVEGGIYNDRRKLVSSILDTTNPNLNPFKSAGGKLLVTIGTNDTRASPGAQLDYYQAVIDTMGQASLNQFARLWVLPMTGHGLSGNAYNVDGDGQANAVFAIPNAYDRVSAIVRWVENGVAPPLDPVVTAGDRSLPMCRYPTYPRYLGGGKPVTVASSYACTAP